MIEIYISQLWTTDNNTLIENRLKSAGFTLIGSIRRIKDYFAFADVQEPHPTLPCLALLDRGHNIRVSLSHHASIRKMSTVFKSGMPSACDTEINSSLLSNKINLPAETVEKIIPTPTYQDEIVVDGVSLKSFGKATLEVRKNTSPEEQDLVPKNDEKFLINAKTIEQIAFAMKMGDNLMLVGETGVGKTSYVEKLACLINQPLICQNLRGDIRSSAFVGQMKAVIHPETKTSVIEFVEGILPRAMKNGWWLLLDEMDAAPAPILFVLQRVLTHRQIVLDEDGGRVVNAHPNFRVIATANTLGRGCDSGLYAGTNILNEAFLDRFGTVIHMNYPGSGNSGRELRESDEEVRIVADKSGLEKKTVMAMVNVARLVREGAQREECNCTFSTRRLINWARKANVIGDKREAFLLCVLNKLSGEDKKFVEQVFERISTW